LPPAAFVSFLQNHDMVGNRACGERIGRIAPAALIETAYVCLLLSPQVPMLFMGEEFAASSPFLYFCDVDAGLARAIAAGRARERERFASFAARASAGSEAGQPSRPRGGHEELAAMPEPNEERAFLMSKLRWEEALEEPHRSRRLLIGRLIELRRLHLRHLQELTRAGTFGLDEGVLRIEWRGRAQGAWRLWINTSTLPRPLEAPRGAELVYRSGDPGGGTMPAALEPSGAILPAGGACVLRGA
jgi:maltooligosyltrehalose trehalohydrolase